MTPSLGRGRSTYGNRPNWPETLAFQCLLAKLGKPQTEYRFHEKRRWRFDLCWPERRLAVEVDGGGFVNGRHSRGVGIESDCEKFAMAMIHGWRVLRVTPTQVKSGQALEWLKELVQP